MPFLMQVLAALLTFYAMAGVWLSMTMVTDRDPRFHWLPLAIGGVAFAGGLLFAAFLILAARYVRLSAGR